MTRKIVLALSGEVHAKDMWPDENIIVPEWNVFEPPVADAGRYDVVQAHFLLQRAINSDVDKLAYSWARLLKPGGELHIHVPSLEWAADQIFSGKPSPLLHIHINGPQVDNLFWMSTFTMQRLRNMMMKLDMEPKIARSYDYVMSIGEDIYKAEQHHIAGVKT